MTDTWNNTSPNDAVAQSPADTTQGEIPRAKTAEEWLAQIPALTRKMATDPVFRAEVEARTV